MKRLQAFKFQLRPDGQQEREMRRFTGSCRFVFNRALALQNENYEAGNKFIPYTKMASWLVEWKNSPEMQWLKDAPSQPLQQSLKDLERAYTNFFQKRAAFPRFKKRGQNDAFRYPQGVKLDQKNSRIFLPKLGWLRYRNSRQVTGIVKNVTVSQSCGKWYISIQTESEVSTPVHPSASMVGLDAGVAKLATLSDGTVFEPVNSFKKNQKKLAALQRELSRKVKFSNNWQKQKRKIQRLHSRIANIRRDYLHKVTTTISKKHAMIVIEDLKVSNMSRSAAGTVSQPGRNVRAKSGLNRSILDQGWYEMRRQLEYKQLWRGGQVLAVPPAYTSQRCACCGHTAKENRLSQSRFVCQACGYTANADVNGARNILAAGHAVLACGGMVQSGRPLKQEPTEMIQATA
ncbi:IS200/IS605 family element transposase accessory protein TnpB [Salmonella enterica subsp. enterica serovar Hermannswerder]|uniref:IS200/IS605 family element transposase accessory protein TnpB n=1 Tax=Salmonella enterica TaxID=28901 RepID=A0A759LM19_SALER|nr:transposase [Salmonella enterica subsp. enterica]EBC1601789.1 IS200/IS605 family element transposase accessory protein TnpB [Salmonella enterica]EBQ9892701.1 transposase [Salmonella enterica subsp. enterica serovar Hvittingfoss]EBS2857831.1 transposase [Salmonella enterica subsp. enterica serovar Richmond]EBS4510163.1 transposase [Salmonella enterica subsp. enterica serovar Adamstua]EBW4541720.1 transposase [Salmonella enterica subsp. enterica serovar Abony]EBX4346671.1 transposase [Salmon